MRSLRRSVVVAGLAVTLVGLGAGAAWADTPTDTPGTGSPVGQTRQPAAKTPPAQARPAAQDWPVAQDPKRAEQSASLDGHVVRADAGSLTVRAADGRVTVVGLTPRTEITKNGHHATAGDLAPADRVHVAYERTGNALTATKVDDSGR